MQPQPGMQHFGLRGDHVVIATNGYVEQEIEVATAGRYRIEIIAGGSPAAEVYPIVEVRVANEALGQAQLTVGTMRPYALEVDLPAGVHALRLVFINDSNVGGEDRNLFIDKVICYGPD